MVFDRSHMIKPFLFFEDALKDSSIVRLDLDHAKVTFPEDECPSISQNLPDKVIKGRLR